MVLAALLVMAGVETNGSRMATALGLAKEEAMEVEDINSRLVIKMETVGRPRIMEMAAMVSLPAMVKVLGLAKEAKGMVTIPILVYQFELGFYISCWRVIIDLQITTKNRCLASLGMLQEHRLE